MKPLRVEDLGLRPYGEALEIQRELRRRRIAGTLTEDVLLLVEHPPVVTLGRGTRRSSLPLAPGALERGHYLNVLRASIARRDALQALFSLAALV